jgi:hypothetical protein
MRAVLLRTTDSAEAKSVIGLVMNIYDFEVTTPHDQPQIPGACTGNPMAQAWVVSADLEGIFDYRSRKGSELLGNACTHA